MNSYWMVGMKRKLGARGQVVIPKEIRERLSLHEGATLTFDVADQTILVRPEASPEEVVKRFLLVKGKRLRKLVDWRAKLDDEYKAPDR